MWAFFFDFVFSLLFFLVHQQSRSQSSFNSIWPKMFNSKIPNHWPQTTEAFMQGLSIYHSLFFLSSACLYYDFRSTIIFLHPHEYSRRAHAYSDVRGVHLQHPTWIASSQFSPSPRSCCCSWKRTKLQTFQRLMVYRLLRGHGVRKTAQLQGQFKVGSNILNQCRSIPVAHVQGTALVWFLR